jgi:hypothetical protein
VNTQIEIDPVGLALLSYVTPNQRLVATNAAGTGIALNPPETKEKLKKAIARAQTMAQILILHVRIV